MRFVGSAVSRMTAAAALTLIAACASSAEVASSRPAGSQSAAPPPSARPAAAASKEELCAAVQSAVQVWNTHSTPQEVTEAADELSRHVTNAQVASDENAGSVYLFALALYNYANAIGTRDELTATHETSNAQVTADRKLCLLPDPPGSHPFATHCGCG